MTPTQQQATLHMDGPAIVLASPGAGKTRVVTYRIVNLVSEGVNPATIAAITFTNKAANEMRERVAKVMPRQFAKMVYISTFHSFCAKLLRIEYEAAGLPQKFTICDSTDSTNYITQAVCLELGVSPKKARGFRDHRNIRYVQRYISDKKQNLLTPDDVFQKAEEVGKEDQQDKFLRRCYERYQAAVERNQSVDFDDLIMKSATLLSRNAEIRNKYAKRIRYMMVDEYQDTNLSQYALVKMLNSHWGNIFVVGDVDQSIFAFRGADIENVQRLEEDHPEAKTFFMEENFRSTPQIAEVANKLIAYNESRKDKKIIAVNKDGKEVRWIECTDPTQEAGFIVDEIISRVRNNEAKYKDFAVIYRTHAKSRPFEDILKAHQIPHKIIGGVGFYQRSVIKDILAFLKLRVNPYDESSFMRIYDSPPRGFGEVSYEKIHNLIEDENISVVKAFKDHRHEKLLNGSPLRGARKLREVFRQMYAHETVSVENIVKVALEATKYREYLDADTGNKTQNRKSEDDIGLLDELQNSAREFDRNHKGGLRRYLEFVSLMQVTDEDDDGDHITLMSCHAAKGLEFPNVYVVGAIESSMPILRPADDAGNVKTKGQLKKDLEEERRIAFVAATRAERELTISSYQRRPMRGSWEECSPSRFIEEMGETVKHEDITRTGMGNHMAAPVQRKRYRNRHTNSRVKMF